MICNRCGRAIVDFLGDIPKKCPHRLVAVDSAMKEIIETNTLTLNRCRIAAQILIEEIGSEGPENVEDIARRAVVEIGKLRRRHLQDDETKNRLSERIRVLSDIRSRVDKENPNENLR